MRHKGPLFAALMCLAAIMVCCMMGGCEGGGGGGASRSDSREPSRCGACNGSGQTKDYNRGVMETCRYCNGTGLVR